MNPLKPCPFCLTDGDDRLIELWDLFDAGHIAHIHCTHCGADGPSEVHQAFARLIEHKHGIGG